MRKRAVVPGTLFSRNSPRVPERATGVDPSTVMDASGIGSPLLPSTIVPPIVCVWARAGAAHVTIVRKRRVPSRSENAEFCIQLGVQVILRPVPLPARRPTYGLDGIA